MKTTEGKTPEDVRSVQYLINLIPMIVMESTASSTEGFSIVNMKHQTHIPSQFDAHSDIEQYSLPFNSHIELKAFAENLYLNRENANVMSPRESGKYLWWLWNKRRNMTIHWYEERTSLRTTTVLWQVVSFR